MPSSASETLGAFLVERGRGNDLHEEVLTLAHHLPFSKFPEVENWAFGLGPSKSHRRTPYWDWLDSGEGIHPSRNDQPSRVLRLSFRPTSTVPSDWVRHSNYVAIRFASNWDPEYDRDDDDTAIPSQEAVRSSETVAEKLIIGGPLCDPAVTADIDSAAGAILAQLDRVSAGTQLNHVIEVITAHASTFGFERDRDSLTLPSIEALPDDLFADHVHSTSPLHVISGIGTRTIERFGSRFAVYPNLLDTDRSDFDGLLPGYQHQPDLDAMKALVAALTECYRSLSTDPDWSGPRNDPAEFRDYPVGNPNHGRDI